jgi:hypothetical protein
MVPVPVSASASASASPAPLSKADYVEVPFKNDPWSFYRSLMRGYLIYSDSSDTNSSKAGRIIHVGRDHDIRNMFNVFTFDEIVITECDMIFGMLSRISTWANEKLNANIPEVQDVESGGDYYMEQLNDFFTQNEAHHGLDSIDFLKKLTDIKLKLTIPTSGGGRTRRDMHNNIKASSSSRGTRKRHTQSGGGINFTGLKTRLELFGHKGNDEKIWSANVREHIRKRSRESPVHGDNKSEVFMAQIKKINVISEEPPKISFLARVISKKMSPPPPPPPPSLTLEEYFKKIAIPIKRTITTTYSEIVPEVWGYPLLMLVPFARAMQCNIELYEKDATTNDFKLRARINHKNHADTTETKMTTKDVTIRILDNNTDKQAYRTNVLEYMSNFALIVPNDLYKLSSRGLDKKADEINKEEIAAKKMVETSRGTKKSTLAHAELKEINAQLETIKEDLYNLTITHPAYSTLDKPDLKNNVSRILKDYKPETVAVAREIMPHDSDTKEESKNSKWWSTSYSSDDLVRAAKKFKQTMKNKIRENISKPRLILRLTELITKEATLSTKKDQLTAETTETTEPTKSITADADV